MPFRHERYNKVGPGGSNSRKGCLSHLLLPHYTGWRPVCLSRPLRGETPHHFSCRSAGLNRLYHASNRCRGETSRGELWFLTLMRTNSMCGCILFCSALLIIPVWKAVVESMYIYSGDVLKYNFVVLVLYWSIPFYAALYFYFTTVIDMSYFADSDFTYKTWIWYTDTDYTTQQYVKKMYIKMASTHNLNTAFMLMYCNNPIIYTA